MSKVRVAVLRGGPSSEYEVSLKTGNAVLSNLDNGRYIPIDVFIDKAGIWHISGCPRDIGTVLENVDVVFNALHGEFGEDGSVQKILDRFGVPYTGSRAATSALCLNKFLTKQALMPYQEELGVHFAKQSVLYPKEYVDIDIEHILSSFLLPAVVKPLTGGSSVGVSIVDDLERLRNAVFAILNNGKATLIEEYVVGKEATCGVVEDFRGAPFYALLPTEIRPAAGHRFFDYTAKYEGASEEICPGNFNALEKEKIQSITLDVHRILGLRHYSRSDFIVASSRIYFLEVNSLPGLTEESLVPRALEAVGCSLPEFLDHLITLALENSR